MKTAPKICRYCGDPVRARGLCTRHYAQDRRGRLGRSREVAAPGSDDVSVNYTFRMPLRLRRALNDAAAETEAEASEIVRKALRDRLRRHYPGRDL